MSASATLIIERKGEHPPAGETPTSAVSIISMEPPEGTRLKGGDGFNLSFDVTCKYSISNAKHDQNGVAGIYMVMLHLIEWKIGPGEIVIGKGDWKDVMKTMENGEVKNTSGTFTAKVTLNNIFGLQRGAYIEVLFLPYLGLLWEGEIADYPGSSNDKTTEYPIDD